mgnify:CR=1 FL=1
MDSLLGWDARPTQKQLRRDYRQEGRRRKRRAGGVAYRLLRQLADSDSVTRRGHISRTSKVLRLRTGPHTEGTGPPGFLGTCIALRSVFGQPMEFGGASHALPDRRRAARQREGQSPEPRSNDIYREAFNSAWQEYQDASKRRGNESLEEVAHKVAWRR